MEYLSTYGNRIINLNLKERELKCIFDSTIELLQNFKKVNNAWLNDGEDARHALELITDIADKKLSYFNTSYKRRKKFSTHPNYVKPTEKAVGTRWEIKKIRNRLNQIIRIPRLIHCTFQYVSILDTLKTIFSCPKFCDMYFNHNEALQNIQQNDRDVQYTSFNSGSAYKNSALFKVHPTSIQIQIAADDFPITNPLQSKASVHSVCAVYFRILNLPRKFGSKLNNIYLVCLCNSNDLKSKRTDVNNLWYPIANEILVLETVGIQANGKSIRGTLCQSVFDNLGANVGLGFAASFNSSYYCRTCTSTKEECQVSTTTAKCKLRTIASYDESIDIVNNSTKVDFSQTKGVKFFCLLNNLNYFHIMENPTADITHDLNEGTLPKLMKIFFTLCVNKKIFSFDVLDHLVKYFNYGYLNLANVPSEIVLDKRSINQNASQSICLFRHLPFILHSYQHQKHLKKAWECIQTMLEICEIVYSPDLNETNVIRLEKVTTLHLILFLELFDEPLIPKQHFMLHYAAIIRMVGPLLDMAMIRFEAKHKFFKNIRNATNNFISINETLARKHQEYMCVNGSDYKDHISHGKINALLDEAVQSSVLQIFDTTEPICETKFLNYNEYEYREGLLIGFNATLYQIKKIIYFNDEFYFLCNNEIKIQKFDKFFNSFEVKKNCLPDVQVIRCSELKLFKSFEIKSVGSKMYVMSDTLELKKTLNKTSP